MLVQVMGVPAVILAIRVMSQRDLIAGVVPATTPAVGRGWRPGLGSFSGPYALAAYLLLAMAVALSLGRAEHPANKWFNSIELSRPLQTMLWTTVILTSGAMATTFGRAALLSIGLLGGVYALSQFSNYRHDIGDTA